MECNGSQLTLTVTDLELGASQSIPVQPGSPAFNTTVPALHLLKVLETLDAENIEITAAPNHWFSIQQKYFKCRIAGMSRESFPELPEPATEHVAQAEGLASAIRLAGSAVGNDDTRFMLTGALLDDGHLVGCDGTRLVTAPLSITEGFPKTLIPKSALKGLAETFGDEPITISRNDRHIFFTQGTRTILARVMTGNYPDYKQVITRHENLVSFEPAAAIKAITQVAKQMGKHRLLYLGIEGEQMFFTSTKQEKQVQSSISIENSQENTWTGEFDAATLLDALKPVNKLKSVDLYFGSPKKPVYFLIGAGEKATKSLVMPVVREAKKPAESATTESVAATVAA
jgi:DNA polymerase-3 subunit beta